MSKPTFVAEDLETGEQFRVDFDWVLSEINRDRKSRLVNLD